MANTIATLGSLPGPVIDNMLAALTDCALPKPPSNAWIYRIDEMDGWVTTGMKVETGGQSDSPQPPKFTRGVSYKGQTWNELVSYGDGCNSLAYLKIPGANGPARFPKDPVTAKGVTLKLMPMGIRADGAALVACSSTYTGPKENKPKLQMYVDGVMAPEMSAASSTFAIADPGAHNVEFKAWYGNDAVGVMTYIPVNVPDLLQTTDMLYERQFCIPAQTDFPWCVEFDPDIFAGLAELIAYVGSVSCDPQGWMAWNDKDQAWPRLDIPYQIQPDEIYKLRLHVQFDQARKIVRYKSLAVNNVLLMYNRNLEFPAPPAGAHRNKEGITAQMQIDNKKGAKSTRVLYNSGLLALWGR